MDKQTNIALELPFFIGDWMVDPAALRIARDDYEIKIEPKVMEVLLCLVKNAGQVISRQQIESAVWPDVIVGYDSLGSAIIKLRKAFKDDPRQPSIIETVPKKGYRLIPDIRQIGVGDTAKQVIGKPESPVPKYSPGNNVAVAAVIAVLILVVVSVILLVQSKTSNTVNTAARTQIPSLAVLPFKNLSDDPQQEYFSDGIASDLITDLSKIDGIAVIARNSTFAYKNTDIDVRQIKEELDIDYVIEGSVRKVGSKVRISARLINASDGVNLWADRFDADVGDIFAVQDEVTTKIVSALEIKLTDAEKTRVAQKYTSNIEAYDYFLQGYQAFWKFTRDDNHSARTYYLKAIELDKNFARAYANLALTYSFDYINGWNKDPVAALEHAARYANKALEINDSMPQVQWAVGLVNTYSKNFDEAISAVEKAIAQSPNFADGYGLLATILNYAAKPEKAREVMIKAMKLNPRHPFIYVVIFGEIHFNLHDYSNAAKYLNQALERNPDAQEARLWLAATYAYQDKLDEASWELDQIRNAGVNLTAEYIDLHIPLKDPAAKNHLVDGLIKAGLSF